LGYIDLYLIHFPIALKYVSPDTLKYPVRLSPLAIPMTEFLKLTSPAKKAWWQDAARTSIELAPISLRETWEALEEVVDTGLAKSIGISNAQAQTLFDLSTYARHPISSLQIEHHPYLVQPTLITLAQKLNIAVTAYSSFGPQSFKELPPAFSARTKDIALLWDVDVVQKAAARTGKTAAQVLLRWATQRGIAVIPKSNNKDRLAQNLEVTDFDLREEEIEAISGLDRGLRFNDPGYYLEKPIPLFA
jgi:D-xylose reductase